MQQIFCPHCGSPITIDETAEAAQLRHAQELEILRLQSELEQLCSRFELQMQQKDGEIAIYKEMIDRLTAGVSQAPEEKGQKGERS